MDFPLHEEFMEQLALNDGAKVPVVVQRVSDRETPSLDFSPPRLVARVRRNSLVAIGSVLTREGVRFLCADQSVTADYRTFWLFEANRRVLWKRPASTNDALTGRPKAAGLSAGTHVWVAWEIMTRQPYERQIGISNEMNRVITAEDVQLNDVIDGQQVKRVNRVLGLSICEVS